MRTPRSERIPAEDLLIEQGHLEKRSPTRRKLLGCLACRWRTGQSNEATPAAYGNEIIKCAGLKSGTVYPMLRQLENIGVVKKEREPADKIEAGRPGRKYYKPAESDLGIAFAALLEAPTSCNLDAAKDTKTEPTPNSPELRNLAGSVISLSAREDLEWIIAEAQLKLDQLGGSS